MRKDERRAMHVEQSGQLAKGKEKGRKLEEGKLKGGGRQERETWSAEDAGSAWKQQSGWKEKPENDETKGRM